MSALARRLMMAYADVMLTNIDLSDFSYSQSLSVSARESSPSDLSISTDGTRLYAVGFSNDKVLQYSLPTPNSLTSASYVRAFDLSTVENYPRGLCFSEDGEYFLVIGEQNDTLFCFHLSTAWDISTASLSSSFDYSAKETGMTAVAITNNGYSVFLLGAVNGKVYKYDLGTQFDVSTAVFDSDFYCGTQESTPTGLWLHHDGTQFLIAGYSDYIYQYDLSTPFDLSSASYTKSLHVAIYETSLSGVTLSSDLSKLFLVGFSSDSVHEYSV